MKRTVRHIRDRRKTTSFVKPLLRRTFGVIIAICAVFLAVTTPVSGYSARLADVGTVGVLPHGTSRAGRDTMRPVGLTGKPVTARSAEGADKMTALISFEIATDNTQETYGFFGVNTVEWPGQLKNGYITFTATGYDPYLAFSGGGAEALYAGTSDRFDYAVIKYRTDVSCAGEFFVHRSDGVQMGQAGSHVMFPYTGDGLWHTQVVDMNAEWGNVSNVSITTFRYDPLAGGEINNTVDVAYIAFFAERGHAERFSQAQQISTVIDLSLTPDDPKVLTVNRTPYGSDTYLFLTGTYRDVTVNVTGYAETDGKVDGLLVWTSFGHGWTCQSAPVGSPIDGNTYAGYALTGTFMPDKRRTVDCFGVGINDDEPAFWKETASHNSDGTVSFIIPVLFEGWQSGLYAVSFLVRYTDGRIEKLPIDTAQVKTGDGKNRALVSLSDSDGARYTTVGSTLLKTVGSTTVDTGLRLVKTDDGRYVGVHLLEQMKKEGDRLILQKTVTYCEAPPVPK